ncbi:MAG: PAS domain-containing sensor histidine kinase [Bacteroidia bacterium]
MLDTNVGFKTLFDNAPIGIVVVGKSGVLKLINPFAEKLFGYPEGELKGKKMDILIPDSKRDSHAKYHAEFLKNPKTRTMGMGVELEGKKKDGSTFPVEISLGHYQTDEGTFAVAYLTDISLRKKGEEDLKRSERKYHFVFDNSPEIRAIYELIFDSTGKVVDLVIKEANTSYENFMRKTGLIGECKGKRISEMPHDYSVHFKECEEVVKGGKLKQYLHYNPLVNWHMLVTIVPMDECHCFAYGMDISAQKNVENELNLLNRELEHRVEERTEALAKAINELASSKEEVVKALEKEKELNELKSRFITTASHEFRTPLATILSSVTLIEKYAEKEEQPKRKRHIDRIQSSVNNLTGILNDFLSLGKLEEGVVVNKPRSLKIDEFVKNLLEENKLILKAGQNVNYNHLTGNADMEADPQILRNIILNLFSNAVKYSGEGDEIRISTKEEDGLIELRIKDFGIGIPEKDQRFVFTRFFRSKNAINIEGTGLGLNIVKKYLELIQGTISFTSVLNEGTEFVVKIPANPVEYFQ